MSKHGSDHYVPLSRLDIIQLSLAFPWVDPWDTPGEPRGTQGGMVQFDISFSLAREGSCLVLDTTSLDHRDISRGYIDIPTGFVRGSMSGSKCFTWYHGRCVKMGKKRAKTWIHLFVIFANEK